MIFNYILIDYENLQSIELSLLKQEQFRIMVFVGAKQEKMSTELAIALHAMGEQAVYIKITGNGPNALDFHIAFYIGQLAASNPQSRFYIISNDTGYDPLLAHLKQRHIRAYRITAIDQITNKPKVPAPANTTEPVAKPVAAKAPATEATTTNKQPAASQSATPAPKPAVVKQFPTAKPYSTRLRQLLAHFEKCASCLPRSLETLTTTINHVFKKELNEKEVTALIEELKTHHLITITNNKVTYRLNGKRDQVKVTPVRLAE